MTTLTLRPDAPNTDFLNALCDEWTSHAFTSSPLPTITTLPVRETSTRSQTQAADSDDHAVQRAGQVGEVAVAGLRR